MLVAIIAVALIVADSQFGQLDRLRSWLGTGVGPIVWMGNIPRNVGAWSEDIFTGRDELKERNDALNARLLVLERRAQKYAALSQENSELRNLLNASSSIDDSVIVADVIGVTPDPFSHEIILDKGSRDGITIGQAVLDSAGLMGQVVQINEFTSRVLLISDSSHAVPVQVNRNGVRANLLGTGEPGTLDLVHVPETSDVRAGDLLVSSGLGGIFPKGYPVATITEVKHDPGEPFSSVRAEPLAQLNQSQMVLIVFKEGAGNRAIPTERVVE